LVLKCFQNYFIWCVTYSYQIKNKQDTASKVFRQSPVEIEGNITINLKETGISTVCRISNDEEILFDLTEGEEVELLEKIAVILLTKLSPEEVKKHLHKFLKFV
jgi:hypothetical protein